MSNIKEAVESKLGNTTMESYVEYKNRIWETPVSLEEVEELSPDKIDNTEFWKFCDEVPDFKYDTIAFGQPKDSSPENVNKQNFICAADLGAFSKIIMHGGYGFNVLDIGAGFGMMKETLSRFAPYTTYHGVDVYPKFEGVLKVDDCILPEEIMVKKFGYIFMVNVHQHLSVRQRRKYYEQIAKICDGYFVLTCHPDNGVLGFRCKDTNRRYTVHYGQFTEMQTYEETIQDLQQHFNIICTQHRANDWSFCFHLTSKLFTSKQEPKNETKNE
jgi:hypothetical protein